MAGQTAGPNGLSFFCGHSLAPWKWHRLKRIEYFCYYFFHGPKAFNINKYKKIC